MTTTKIYTYLGENGTIESPVLLDLFHITKYVLYADQGYKLTKDNHTFFNTVTVSEKDLPLWMEVSSNS